MGKLIVLLAWIEKGSKNSIKESKRLYLYVKE